MTNAQELEKLAKAATPGPWRWENGRLRAPDQTDSGIDEYVLCPDHDPRTDRADIEASEDDLAFIAAANPAAILSLLSDLRAAREARDAAETFIADMGLDLHHARVADWFPEGANNAAMQMSEDMRLIGNRCADYSHSGEAARLAASDGEGVS